MVETSNVTNIRFTAITLGVLKAAVTRAGEDRQHHTVLHLPGRPGSGPRV